MCWMHQPSVVVLLEVSRGRIEEEKYFPVNTIEGNMSLLETKTNDVKDSNPLREEKHTMTLFQQRWKKRQEISEFSWGCQLTIRQLWMREWSCSNEMSAERRSRFSEFFKKEVNLNVRHRLQICFNVLSCCLFLIVMCFVYDCSDSSQSLTWIMISFLSTNHWTLTNQKRMIGDFTKINIQGNKIIVIRFRGWLASELSIIFFNVFFIQTMLSRNHLDFLYFLRFGWKIS